MLFLHGVNSIHVSNLLQDGEGWWPWCVQGCVKHGTFVELEAWTIKCEVVWDDGRGHKFFLWPWSLQFVFFHIFKVLGLWTHLYNDWSLFTWSKLCATTKNKFVTKVVFMNCWWVANFSQINIHQRSFDLQLCNICKHITLMMRKMVVKKNSCFKLVK